MDNIVSFIAASVILTIAPGPDIIFVMTQSAAKGKWAGINTALGLCTGLIVHTALVAFGLSILISESPTLFNLLKFGGAAYLFYLAYLSFRERGGADSSPKDGPKLSSLYKQGIIMNLLNPKVILFFLALLPQFVDTSAGNVQIQMVILGVIFILQAIIVFSAVSVFAGYFSNQLKSNVFFTDYIGFIKGMIFILIGLRMAF